jgi:hypothetical protein
MTDLEAAATEALASVRALEDKVNHAIDHLKDLRGSVEAIDAQCDGTWKRFEGMIDALQVSLREQASLLETHGHEARQAVDQARAQVEGHAPLVEQALEVARQGTQTLREHVQQAETEVMPLVDELETTARAVVAAATQARTELDAAVAEARQFMEEEAVDALRQLQEAVRQRTAEWRSTLQQEHRGPAEADTADWSTRLTEVEGTVETAFAGAVQHADEVARFALDKLKTACDDALQELDRLSDPVVQELGELKSQAEARRGDAGRAGDGLEQDVRDTIQVLEDADTSLTDIAIEFAKYYFTGM